MANKGFSLDMDSERDPRKRPKFNAADLDFLEDAPSAVTKKNARAESAENFRNDMWMMPHETRPESKTGRFIGLSMMAHALFAVGMMTISVSMLETPKPETIEFEIADSTPMPVPRGSKTEATQGASQAKAAQAPTVAEEVTSKEEPASANDVVVPAKKSQPKTAAKPVAAKTRSVKAAPVPAKQNAVATVKPVVQESEVAVPESVDDMDAPLLEENEFQANAAGQLNDGELDKNFAKVDQKNAKGVKAVAEEIDQDADQMTKNDLDEIDQLDRQNQKEAALMAARSNELKQKNAAALAAAQAAENAAREKAAREAAARAEAARRAQAAADARGNGSQGEGSGSKGSSVGTTGLPNGGAVRSIEQLRQMPGNPKPMYSDNERMAKQQGNVSFFAYITREGYPTQFKQARSTGYTNLDGKTLEALKKWRFYPGQEGWVEIPFSWDLKGGASETRALGTRQNGAARSSLR